MLVISRHFLRRITFPFLFTLSCCAAAWLMFVTFVLIRPAAAADAEAAGLRAEYFSDSSFGTLAFTRTDAKIDFAWEFDKPDATLGPDNFSIRWTGTLTPPTTGNYTFVTYSDDGVRVWLGNQIIIDNWRPHALTEDRSAVLTLTGGQSYNLRVEYYEATANAIIRFHWIRPGQTVPEAVPTAQLATPVNPNPQPRLASVTPNTIPYTNAPVAITVSGTNFLPGAVIEYNKSARTTTFVSSTQLTTVLPVTDVGLPNLATITVVNPHPGGGTSNLLNFTVTGGFEADVAPRPNGSNDGRVTVTDWTQVGRFTVGLDAAAVGTEFQRADCAPRSTRGDGRITLTDWVQAGRYASALDPITSLGGPTSQTQSAAPEEETTPSEVVTPPDAWLFSANARTVTAAPQTNGTLSIACQTHGGENAFSFSAQFDPAQWEFVAATTGTDARQAVLHINPLAAAQGRIGLALALPPGQQFAPGLRQIAVLTFRPRSGNISALLPTINFADQPVARQIVDVNAQRLAHRFVVVEAAPVIARAGK